MIRDRLPDVLNLFDFAEPSLVTGKRETTNVPVQALYLMNSPFVQERAAQLSARLRKETSNNNQLVRRAFALCFGRLPDDDETQQALEFLDDEDESTMLSFCQAMLCTAEFRNLD